MRAPSDLHRDRNAEPQSAAKQRERWRVRALLAQCSIEPTPGERADQNSEQCPDYDTPVRTESSSGHRSVSIKWSAPLWKDLFEMEYRTASMHSRQLRSSCPEPPVTVLGRALLDCLARVDRGGWTSLATHGSQTMSSCSTRKDGLCSAMKALARGWRGLSRYHRAHDGLPHSSSGTVSQVQTNGSTLNPYRM